MSVLRAALLSALLPLKAWGQGATDEWLRRPVNAATFETFKTFFVYDRDLAFEAMTADTATVDGIFAEHVSFVSTPGVRVTAKLFEPASDRSRRLRTVILIHGGSLRGKDGTTVLADHLARKGWRVIAIDMPHFGERQTALLRSGTNPEKLEKLYNQPGTYLAWVTQVIKDVGRTLDFVVRERSADSTRVALLGLSRGAVLSAMAGAVHERFRAVALAYGGHAIAGETGHLPAACPANYIGRLSPRPVLLLNSKGDAVFDEVTQVQPMHALVRQPKTVVWVNTGHVFPPSDVRITIVDWLSTTVR